MGAGTLTVYAKLGDVYRMYEIDTQVIELAIQLKERRKRGDATVWRVVDILVGHPVLTANEVARQLIRVTFPAANDAIAELVALEILRPSTAQRRNLVFQAHQVLNALHTGMDDVLDGTNCSHEGAALGSGVGRSRPAMPEILLVVLQQMTGIDWIVRSVQKPTYSRDNSSRKKS